MNKKAFSVLMVLLVPLVFGRVFVVGEAAVDQGVIYTGTRSAGAGEYEISVGDPNGNYPGNSLNVTFVDPPAGFEQTMTIDANDPNDLKATVTLKARFVPGFYNIGVLVKDGSGKITTGLIQITATDETPPVIGGCRMVR